MLTRIMKKKNEGEAGFTLIELLVVVAIIGILAAIAIPVFLNQRNAARNSSVKADLNSVAQAMETAYTTSGAFPTTAASLGSAPLSPGNQVKVIVDSTTPTKYHIWACNDQSKVGYVWASVQGGLQATEYAAASCAASATVTFATTGYTEPVGTTTWGTT